MRYGDQETDPRKIREFWSWFSKRVANIDPLQDSTFHAEIDEHVGGLNHALGWELGPGLRKLYSLAVSPNLDRALLPVAAEIIRLAPRLLDWEFHSTRPLREWSPQFDISASDGSRTNVDARDWSFVLLRYPDAGREVLLAGSTVADIRDSDRPTAAAIVLEGILGEEAVLTLLGSFELLEVLPERFRAQARPLSQLRSAVVMN